MKSATRVGLVLLSLSILGITGLAFAVDEARQEYNKMVEEATKEADQYLQEKQKETQAAQDEAQAQQDAALDDRVQAERARIEAQMDIVAGRGMSDTYTQGMKENQLQQLQEKLDLLTSDPAAYFGQQ